MDLVLRTLAVYLVVLVLVRLSGKRTLAEVSAFDAVLLLIISEATQQALLGEDFSVTAAAIVIAVLIGTDRLLDALEWRFPRLSKVSESLPLVLIRHGEPVADHLARSHVRVQDVMAVGRAQGLERLEQVKYAVLEENGGISVIPYAAGDRDPAPDAGPCTGTEQRG